MPTGAQTVITNQSDANSSSHQFQFTLDKRFSRGLQFRAAYTLSKTIDISSGFRARSSEYTDPTNPAFDRGLADFDARQRLVVSPIWQIPKIVEPIGSAVFVFVLVGFMLIQQRDLRARVVRLFGQDRLAETTRTLDEAESGSVAICSPRWR